MAGGLFNLAFASTEQDEFFLEWLTLGTMKEGQLAIYKGDDDHYMKIEFWDCYCVGFHEAMALGSSPMEISLRLSPAITRNRNMVEHEKTWKVTDIHGEWKAGSAGTVDRLDKEDATMPPDHKGANNPASSSSIKEDSIWHINPRGYINHTGEGDRDYAVTHTLHAVSDRGERGACVVLKDGGILNQLAEELNIGENVSLGQSISGPVANSSNRDDAYNLFKFAAKNSNVEWSYQRYTDGTLAVATAHENSTTIRGSDHRSNKGKIVAADVHSHPGSTSIDMKPSSPDITSRNYYLKKNPHVKVQIYIPNSPYSTARMLDIVNNKWIKY